MFLHQTHLAYEQHLNARDHMLNKHPKLRYVGLHLASQEWDTDEVAFFLDEFPNTMVDLAERICHLQYQAISDWQKVHDFMVAYQDRIIYGTDCIDDGSLSDNELVNLMDNRYRMHWKFFTGSERMSAPKVAGQFRGLGLPFEVIEKIYNTNAARCYGI
ncbi:MAG: amidohydrolase family protein [Pricia sp.]|nr:amidohydrolase family protein [Pricia sp.]